MAWRLFADAFALHPLAQGAVSTLVQTCPELSHLAGARIACVGSQRTPMLHGWPVFAFIAPPKVQGPFRTLFEWQIAQLTAPLFEGEYPDFLMVVDAPVLGSLTPVHREAIVYHELLHVVAREHPETGVPKVGRDGRLLLRLRPHTFERFEEEFDRYGADPSVLAGIDQLALAIARNVKRRRAA